MVWDVESGDEFLTIAAHDMPVRFTEFSPDGRWLLSSSVDGTAKLWSADPVGLARSRLPRTFTPEECARWGIARRSLLMSANQEE